MHPFQNLRNLHISSKMQSHLLSTTTISLILILHPILAYEDPRIYSCNPTTTNTYTSNSSFSTNLNQALNFLQNNTAATGFTTTTITTNSHPVSALALCRGTLASLECQTCIDAAVSGIQLVCSNQTSAQVWYTYCMIRYSSTNFVNKSDSSDVSNLFDTRNVPNWYFQTIEVFLKNLSSVAGNSDKRYAIAQTKEPNNQPVYGYVDCTRDVDGESCRKCLLTAIGRVEGCCLGKWAGWVVTPTCNIQFHMEPVHKDWETAPFLEIDVSLPPPPPKVELPEIAAPPVEVGPRAGGIWDRRRRIAVVVVVCVVGVFMVIVGCWVVFKGRRKMLVVIIERRDVRNLEMVDEIETRNFFFDFDVLVAATRNFSDANLLGSGGFGSVYKGILPSGEDIAVKKLAANSTQGVGEFSNEVKVLLKLQHRNLVQLHGCCAQGEERMLVYEYLPNKSLDHFLFDKSKSALLDWRRRHNIIMGVARGLVYLHQDALLKIVHRDIKASNILLDEELNPKISDFGLAKLFKDEETHLRTRRIVGTYGYMAPEYAIRGVLSFKNDVFSFGVLLLEIISGRKNHDLQFELEMQELLKLAWRLEQEGRLLELVDVTIGSFPLDLALKFLRIGLLCSMESLQDRPIMPYVLTMLSTNSTSIPPLGRPAYHGEDDHHNEAQMNNVGSDNFTRNSITISLQDGR